MLRSENEKSSTTKPTPLVSIVIPTRNRWYLLSRLLHSISQLSGIDLKRKVEVILVDDASRECPTEFLVEFYNQFFHILYLRNDRRIGASASRNKGSNSAKGKYVLFLDDDCALPRDFLEALLGTIESEDCAMCGGTISYLNNPEHIQHAAWRIDLSGRSVRGCYGTTYESARSINGKKILEADFIPTAFLVKREVVLEVGGFDERILLYYDDTDFGYRVKKKGYNILINTATTVYHDATTTQMIENPWKTYMNLRNCTYFVAKHTRLRAVLIYFSCSTLALRFTLSTLHFFKRKPINTNLLILVKDLFYLFRATLESSLVVGLARRGTNQGT